MGHGLADQQFHSYEDIEKLINSWIASKDEHFYRKGIRALPEWWKKVVAIFRFEILCVMYINMEGGALGMVLLISRLAGVAPFLRAAEYRVSLPLVIFAKLFILITAIDFIIMLAPNLFYHYGYLTTYEILTTTSRILTLMTTFVSIFNSPKRTMRVLQFLKELDQMDKKISDLRQYANEIKLTLLIILYLHLSLVLRGLYLNTGKINEKALNFLMLITYYMISLSELQVALFARRTMFSLKVINSSLKKLCKNSTIKDISSKLLKIRMKHPILAWEKVKEQSFNTRSVQGWLLKSRLENIDEPVKLIRQCLVNYMHLGDIITASMDGEELFIATVLYIVNLLIHAYKIILYALATGPNFVKPNIYVEFFWCIVNSVCLIVFMEPYHKTQSEIEKLQFLLMTLKCANVDEVDVANELHLFGRVVNINKPKYCPLGMFTLNRILVVKIFGSLLTYLVIVVTYGPDLDNLRLVTE